MIKTPQKLLTLTTETKLTIIEDNHFKLHCCDLAQDYHF